MGCQKWLCLCMSSNTSHLFLTVQIVWASFWREIFRIWSIQFFEETHIFSSKSSDALYHVKRHLVSPDFGRSVNPISTRRGRLYTAGTLKLVHGKWDFKNDRPTEQNCVDLIQILLMDRRDNRKSKFCVFSKMLWRLNPPDKFPVYSCFVAATYCCLCE